MWVFAYNNGTKKWKWFGKICTWLLSCFKINHQKDFTLKSKKKPTFNLPTLEKIKNGLNRPKVCECKQWFKLIEIARVGKFGSCLKLIIS